MFFIPQKLCSRLNHDESSNEKVTQIFQTITQIF